MNKYSTRYIPTPFSPDQIAEIPYQTKYSTLVIQKMREYHQRLTMIHTYDASVEEMARSRFDTLSKIASLHIVNHFLWDKRGDILTQEYCFRPNMNKLKNTMAVNTEEVMDTAQVDELCTIMQEALGTVIDYYLTGGKNYSQPAKV
jgi:hypothetical protein